MTLWKLQQYLPFTVLKQAQLDFPCLAELEVATVPTVYGIETHKLHNVTHNDVVELQQYLPFTVLKLSLLGPNWQRAMKFGCNSTYRLRYWNSDKDITECCLHSEALQQYLPFTVLKLL